MLQSDGRVMRFSSATHSHARCFAMMLTPLCYFASASCSQKRLRAPPTYEIRAASAIDGSGRFTIAIYYTLMPI